MSRGHGKMERHVLAMLTLHGECTTAFLAGMYRREKSETSDAVRSSLNRALRKLQASKNIFRNEGGNAFGWCIGNHLRLQTAYHEAGHAVIAKALSLPIKYATIKPSKNTAGHVEFSKVALVEEKIAYWYKKLPRQIHSQYQKHILVDMAGRLAEDRLIESKFKGDDLEKHRRDESRYGARSDRETTHYALSRIIGVPPDVQSPGATREEREKLKRKAKALVDKHWAEIEAVAVALVKNETLDSDEIEIEIEVERAMRKDRDDSL